MRSIGSLPAKPVFLAFNFLGIAASIAAVSGIGPLENPLFLSRSLSPEGTLIVFGGVTAYKVLHDWRNPPEKR